MRQAVNVKRNARTGERPEDRAERASVETLARATAKRIRAEDRARTGDARPMTAKRIMSPVSRAVADSRAVARAGRYVSATKVRLAPYTVSPVRETRASGNTGERKRVVVRNGVPTLVNVPNGRRKVRSVETLSVILPGESVSRPVPVALIERWADGILRASETGESETGDSLASLFGETRRSVARVALAERAQAGERDAARAWFRATVESVTGRARAARLARERERQASLRAREASLRAARKVEAYTVPVALPVALRVAPLSGPVGCGSLGS